MHIKLVKEEMFGNPQNNKFRQLVNNNRTNNRAKSQPTVRNYTNTYKNKYSNLPQPFSCEKGVMADTYDDVLIKEEYQNRLETLINKNNQLENKYLKMLKDKDIQFEAKEEEYVQDSAEQLEVIQKLSDKLDDYIHKHERKINEKDEQIDSLNSIIANLQNQSRLNTDQLRREKDSQIMEIQREADFNIKQMRDQLEDKKVILMQEYDIK